MHMADALLSPLVGGSFWAVSASILGYSSKKLGRELDDKKVPLMGVLGAFIFAAQMLNFAIPGTGSSGHLGGGMILAILLGPHAAFITIASILTVQALFFADGGLLALGCNILNLGFVPAFIAYPLIYKPIVGQWPTPKKIALASLLASIASLQMGALGVVLETTLSGFSALSFGSFLTLMLPIHLAIGLIEGLVTSAVVSFVFKARPEILAAVNSPDLAPRPSFRKITLGFLFSALVAGGVISWWASEKPDGLEWSIQKVTGQTEIPDSSSAIHGTLNYLQEKIAILPDYAFRTAEPEPPRALVEPRGLQAPLPKLPPSVILRGNRSLSGILGGVITMVILVFVGGVLKKNTRRKINHSDKTLKDLSKPIKGH